MLSRDILRMEKKNEQTYQDARSFRTDYEDKLHIAACNLLDAKKIIMYANA